MKTKAASFLSHARLLHFTSRWLVLSFLAFVTLSAGAQTRKPATEPSGDLLLSHDMNPSTWLNNTENKLILIESRISSQYDTSFMGEKFTRLSRDLELAQNDFTGHGKSMRIRTLDDIRARLLQIAAQLETWRQRISGVAGELEQEIQSLHAIRSDSTVYTLQQDSALWAIYQGQFADGMAWIDRIDSAAILSLRRAVDIEARLNGKTYTVSKLLQATDVELRERSHALTRKTHPAIWELKQDSYPEGIGAVFLKTLRQNMESLKFYGKNAYIRAILFRVLLLLISMLPIWYFRKLKKEGRFDHAHMRYRYVHKYTGAAASSFMLVMAPYVFVNAPHIFLEAILVTLTFLATIIFVKENPSLSKRRLFLLLGIYTLLKLANLLVDVTVFGRIVWTLSIVILIPLGILLSRAGKTQLPNKTLFKVVLLVCIVMFSAGWILNLVGYFPLGRILMIAGLEQFFMAVILHVAIYSLTDFVTIIGDMYNTRDRVSVVRTELIYNKLLKLVTFLAVVYWIISLLWSLNAYTFVTDRLSEIFGRTINIGGTLITPGSFVMFFIVLIIAFYLSSLLDGLFYDEKRSAESTYKTSLGSMVVLLRFFILAAGFLVGIVIAGIPLSKLNLFVGALGLGIGFGIQQLFNNLLSGIIIAFERPIFVGDVIEMDGVKGRVTDIGLRATKVDILDGAELVIPNGDLTGRTLKNWTLTSKQYKLENHIYVDLRNDVDKTVQALEAGLQNTPNIIPSPPPLVRLKEITPTALHFVVSCWVKDIGIASKTQDEILRSLHRSLDQAGIRFPRKIDLDDQDA